MNLKIKICGMRESDNILEAAELKPELMGFIFYSSSPRCATGFLDQKILSGLNPDIRKTGVFVNEDFEVIITIARKLSLDIVQLHGNESPDLCRRITEEGISVMKAFGITGNTYFQSFKKYIPYTEYFLFDNITTGYGGSGNKFDWKVLSRYYLGHPFFISGGISIDNAGDILEMKIPSLYGIDLNSRFEISPGLKDIPKLKTFITDIRLNNNTL